MLSRYDAERRETIASLRASLRGRDRLHRLAVAISGSLEAHPLPPLSSRRPVPMELEDGSFL